MARNSDDDKIIAICSGNTRMMHSISDGQLKKYAAFGRISILRIRFVAVLIVFNMTERGSVELNSG